MSQAKKVWEHLLKHGSLREKYGVNMILDEWITKTRKEYNGKGKEEKVTIRYKKYFLNKLEDLGCTI